WGARLLHLVVLISSRTYFDGEPDLYTETPVLRWCFNDYSLFLTGEGLLILLFEVVSLKD
ncbi:MAG: hypothetical protein MUQ67_04850, partial [Pirellulales bacterium]|nr:hypothetical protein [Pirellulales bacterium]